MESNLFNNTTETYLSGTNGSNEVMMAVPVHIPRNIHYILMGIIINSGIVLNALALLVFLGSPTLRKAATGRYLIALAVADSLFMFGELLRWLNAHNALGVDINFMHRNLFLCKWVYFMRYVGKLASSWITVAITTERLLMVVLPLKHMHFSSKRTTDITIGVTFTVCTLFGSFPLWVMDIKKAQSGSPRCFVSDKFWYELGSWVSLRIGSLILPGLAVSIMTGIIIYHLLTARRRRHRRLSSRRIYQRQDTIETSKASLEKQLTYMLLTVAISFILLRLPYTIFYYISQYKPHTEIWTDFRIYFTYKMTDCLATLNYAINFFLYYFCGSVFRKQMKMMSRRVGGVCSPRVRRKSSSSFHMSSNSHFSKKQQSTFRTKITTKDIIDDA